MSKFALVRPQKHYNGIALLVVCVCITMILWIAYDAVLPALPAISADFDIDASVTNLILFPFLLAQAFGQLLSGTISDRYGRRPLVLASAVVFMTSSLACALSTNIWVLIAVRIPQGFFAGSYMVALLAIVNDSYRGKDFDRGVTVMQSMPAIGPIIAPFLGSLLLMVANWHAIFVCLAVLGCVAFVLTCLMSETLPPTERECASLRENLGSMVTLCHEPGFLATTVVLALIGMPLMSFLAVSSYIYMEQMHMSYLSYSIAYALSSVIGVISPLAYLRFSGHLREGSIAIGCMVLALASGVMFLAIGPLGAVWVFVSSVPLFFMESIFRAQGFVALTENRERSRGAANSVATFIYSAISSVGTEIASLPWPTPLIGVGVILLSCAAASFAIWGILAKRGHLLARYRQ